MPSKQLTAPCVDCPFRSDKHFHLTDARRREIRDSLRDGAAFWCHKTTNASGARKGAELFCAGALIAMEHDGGAHLNQMVRIMGRFGSLDLDKLELDSPVYHGLDEWVEESRAIDRERGYE